MKIKIDRLEVDNEGDVHLGVPEPARVFIHAELIAEKGENLETLLMKSKMGIGGILSTGYDENDIKELVKNGQVGLVMNLKSKDKKKANISRILLTLFKKGKSNGKR